MVDGPQYLFTGQGRIVLGDQSYLGHMELKAQLTLKLMDQDKPAPERKRRSQCSRGR